MMLTCQAREGTLGEAGKEIDNTLAQLHTHRSLGA